MNLTISLTLKLNNHIIFAKNHWKTTKMKKWIIKNQKILRYWSSWSSPKLARISSEGWLYERLMSWSWVKFATLLGITPEKAFDERSRRLRPIGSCQISCRRDGSVRGWVTKLGRWVGPTRERSCSQQKWVWLWLSFRCWFSWKNRSKSLADTLFGLFLLLLWSLILLFGCHVIDWGGASFFVWLVRNARKL